jgi:hypothetical protein
VLEFRPRKERIEKNLRPESTHDVARKCLLLIIFENWG